ncbi:MAG: metal ABC transporter ATP-binding protein [Roseinatronobacter sp.]
MANDAFHDPGTALHLEDLTVTHGLTTALLDVDLDIPAGVLAGIIGPNGAGKSTLLNAALGLVRPVAGHIRWLGQPVDQMRRRIAYVPQRQSVDWDFPATARDVVTMGLYGELGLFRRPRATHRARAEAALADVGLQDYADRQISALSGGQQQRVFLARALVQDAPLLVLDEPMAGVDAASEAVILNLLRRERAKGRTVIVVHHDLTSVQSYFDWLVVLNRKIIAQGPVAQVYTAATLRAAYGVGLPILTGGA